MKQKFLTALALLFAITGAVQAQQQYDFFVVHTDGTRYECDTTDHATISIYTITPGSVTDIIIPSALTYNGRTYPIEIISEGALMSDDDVTSVVIPSSVRHIGYYAFYYCENLSAITIGSEVDTIESLAFADCSSLTTVHYAARHAVYVDDGIGGNGVFTGSPVTTIYIDSTVEQIAPDGMFDDLSSLQVINIAAPRLIPITSRQFYASRNLTINVPCEYAAAYRAHSVWSSLGSINTTCSYFTVNALCNNALMGSAHGGGHYNAADTAIIYATPLPGYTFLRWNDSVLNNPRRVVVNSDTSLTAIFSLPDTTPIVQYRYNIISRDTIIYSDSIRFDTISVFTDTISVYDTVHIDIYDTIHTTFYDTIHVVVYDTIRNAIVDAIGEQPIKVYLSGNFIVVEGASVGEIIRLYSLDGRLLMQATATGAAPQRIVRPATKACLLRVGSRQAHKLVFVR
ncbi:MAG: leucine-rich repeat domain-containing protein [Bacteroidales bacterium]|nr:leucine-rich repeat domain-containing protein [Bacteroidales bacterium]